jgi:hypothetical protein
VAHKQHVVAAKHLESASPEFLVLMKIHLLHKKIDIFVRKFKYRRRAVAVDDVYSIQ